MTTLAGFTKFENFYAGLFPGDFEKYMILHHFSYEHSIKVILHHLRAVFSRRGNRKCTINLP